MDSAKLIRTMMDESGMRGVDLSRAMGRSSVYMATVLSRNSVPRLDTFTEMANAMGYEVVIRGHGSEHLIMVEPSEEL